ncbi:MAG: cupin domain-containing protein [Marinagarivorans sp.]|nr:cupin domain-containing protein [Marinagarivorans sp.]
MNTIPLRFLGDLPVEAFLRDYWQQKPLFIKNALGDWKAPLDGGDIAGLALEESVESRLIIEKTTSNPLKSQWKMEHGPIDEERFDTLPENHFTILVQALDQMCPEVHALLNQFRFIPNWRLDDVMASVAPTGGSVGPHFDYYDVFLLQATGTRQWKIGQTCNAQSPLQDDCPLKILTDFDTQAEYTAEAGDLLYIPANVAHWGVSQSDDCTTYSIGFRAPSYSDILLELSQELASQLSNDVRYRDQANGFSDNANYNPGEIPHAVAREIAERCQALFTPEKVAAWLGKYLTEAKRDTPEITTSESEPEAMVLAVNARAAYTQADASNNPILATVFINGQSWRVSLALAQKICSYTTICPSDYPQADQTAINEWIENDYLNLPNTTDSCTND